MGTRVWIRQTIGIVTLLPTLALTLGSFTACSPGEDAPSREQEIATVSASAPVTLATANITCTNDSCPSGIGVLTSKEGETTRVCTAFMIGPYTVATSADCLPPSSREVSGDCSGVTIHFPKAGDYPAESVACGSVESMSDSLRTGEIVSQNYAVLRLKNAPMRSPFELDYDGIKPGMVETYRAETISPSSLIVRIMKARCTAVLRSQYLPSSDSPQSSVIALAGCAGQPGSVGAPLIREGKVVGILHGPPAWVNRLEGLPSYLDETQGSYGYATNLACVPGLDRSYPISLAEACSNRHLIDQIPTDSERNFEALKPLAAIDLEQKFKAWVPEIEDRPDLNLNDVFEWQLKEVTVGTQHYSLPVPRCFRHSKKWFKHYRFRLRQRKSVTHDLWTPLWRPFYQVQNMVPFVEVIPEFWIIGKLHFEPTQMKRHHTGFIDLVLTFTDGKGRVEVINKDPIPLCN